MNIKPNRHVRLWVVMIVAAIFWTVGTGFYQNLSASNEETYKGLKVFSDVIEIIEKNYVDPVDSKVLIEEAIKGMVNSLDPHSSLLLPDEFEELQIDTQGKFSGIGIHVTMLDGFVTVVSPIEGTPAFRAGIKERDRIIKVDGETIKDLRTAVKKMRGPKGTSVALTIMREGAKKPLEFNLIRDVIPIHSVKATLLQPGYGYVWVTNFREQTTDDLITALKKLNEEAPLKGLILDLRNNPGGILDQAIKVSDVFLDKGIILTIKGRLPKHTKTFSAHSDDVDVKYDFPMVVLINGGSASASEIVAGALQDQKRALILGTTSFGKGSVQTIETLRDGYGLKYTIARYYTPSGRSIQAKGVEPDIVVQHQTIEEAKSDHDEGLLKEKDLENHLDAGTEEDAEPDAKEGETDEGQDPQKHKVDFRIGRLNVERLMSDNQVIRAMDILKSHEIFKTLHN
jgi:carboxyl-terminal processing protease